MATPRILEIKPRNTVGNDTTVEFVMPVSRRYLSLHMQYTVNGVTTDASTVVDDVRVYIDDKIQREHSAAELNEINEHNGRNSLTEPDNLDIWFREPNRRNAASEQALGWSMGDVVNFRVEVDITTLGATPKFRMFSVFDSGIEDGKLLPLGIVTKFIRRQVSITSTGEKDLDDLPLNLGAYSGIYLFQQAAGDISSFEVEMDNVDVIEDIPVDLYQHITQGYNPNHNNADFGAVGTFLPVKFDLDWSIFNILKVNTAFDFRPKITMTTTNDPTAILEIVGNRN